MFHVKKHIIFVGNQINIMYEPKEVKKICDDYVEQINSFSTMVMNITRNRDTYTEDTFELILKDINRVQKTILDNDKKL